LYTGFWLGNVSERDQLVDIGVDGRIILRLVFKKWDSGHVLIYMVQNTNKWQAVFNAVMNIQVP
jgi:hypothetical protein